MSEVVVIDEDVERKMKEAMSMLNNTLQGEDYQTLINYSKGDTCPIFYNSAGGARKKGRRVTRKRGGVGKGKRADGADAPDVQGAPETPFMPDFATGPQAQVPPRNMCENGWDNYDYAAAAFLLVAGGGGQYLGGFSALVDTTANTIAAAGGIPTQQEACDPLNMLKNAQLGSVITGMMTCEEVQKRYLAIVGTMVATLGAGVLMSVSTNAKTAFENVNWSNPAKIAFALLSAGHTTLADGLRQRARDFTIIADICKALRNIIKKWSGVSEISPGVSGSSPDVSGSSPDVSGSSGGRRRRRRQTKKRRKRTKKR